MEDIHKSISVKEIGFTRVGGEGVLTVAGRKTNVKFTVFRQLSRTIIAIPQQVRRRPDEHVSLAGKLADGRDVRISHLSIPNLQDGLTELKPYNCPVEIGSPCSPNPLSSTYFLSGLYEGNFIIECNAWQLSLCSDPGGEANTRAYRSLKIQPEGSILTLTVEGKSRDEHEDFAWDLLPLLSLACGSGVACSRWSLHYGDSDFLEVWQEMAGDDLGPGPIIPDYCFSDFLKQVLPMWQGMSDDEKHVIRVAILHLNVSGSGYLDNRLFQVAQIWEYLAGCWVPSQALTETEKELKRDLLKCCKKWRKRHGEDPEGRISQRISFAFNWPLLKRQIESLTSMFCLDITEFDLDHLKGARDKAGHSISLEAGEVSSVPHIELLIRAQRLIQVILLLKLGYRGLVVSHKDGWRANEHIDKFLRNEFVK